MGLSDRDYINFSEDHELNYQLEKVNKRQTEENREVLKQLGKFVKDNMGMSRLKHEDFFPFVLVVAQSFDLEG